MVLRLIIGRTGRPDVRLERCKMSDPRLGVRRKRGAAARPHSSNLVRPPGHAARAAASICRPARVRTLDRRCVRWQLPSARKSSVCAPHGQSRACGCWLGSWADPTQSRMGSAPGTGSMPGARRHRLVHLHLLRCGDRRRIRVICHGARDVLVGHRPEALPIGLRFGPVGPLG